ncbi:hypothetical protein R3P38DRAFT_2639866 [Favolaschia claudopus]|uniref:MYND-type domain-containing protein n=1 Tax=Favolaschia claudopus TaxID=2862362 RepID=A0AAW0AKW9_9AGAR
MTSIHRWFRPETLELLPISLRRFAIPAATGSVQDMERLLDLLVDQADTDKYTYSLPVIYANLDPAKIPTEENLNVDSVACANMALDQLHDLRPKHKSAFAELWHRAWPWIVFFQAYRECLSDRLMRLDPCFDVVILITRFRKDKQLESEIFRTAGVRTLVVDAWFAIGNTENRLEHSAFTNLCRILPSLTADEPDHFDEIIEGAGGVANLSAIIGTTVLDCVRVAIGGPATHVDSLINVLTFIRILGHTDIMSPALAAAGGAKIITAASCTGFDPDGTVLEPVKKQTIVLLCLDAISTMIYSPEAMCAALPVGLLQSVLFCSTLALSQDEFIHCMLARILPSATVYHSVLVVLKEVIPMFSKMPDSMEFQRCWMYKDWMEFMTLVERRIAFMQQTEASHGVSMKACSNCNKMRERKDFRKCSRCQTVFYCSLECQKADWNTGHRETCQTNQIYSLRNMDITPHNYSFLRELFHKDMMKLKPSQLIPAPQSALPLSYLRELAQRSERNPFILVVHYQKGIPCAYIGEIAWARRRDFQHRFNWDDLERREARSSGLMELQTMVVQDGSPWHHRHFVFPQWSDRPGFLHRLYEVVRRDISLEDAEQEVERLCIAYENESGTRIH